MPVTDEIRETARPGVWRAMVSCVDGDPLTEMPAAGSPEFTALCRLTDAIVEAVAPLIRAEALREAAVVARSRIRSTAGLTSSQVIARSHEFARSMEAEAILRDILALSDQPVTPVDMAD